MSTPPPEPRPPMPPSPPLTPPPGPDPCPDPHPGPERLLGVQVCDASTQTMILDPIEKKNTPPPTPPKTPPPQATTQLNYTSFLKNGAHAYIVRDGTTTPLSKALEAIIGMSNEFDAIHLSRAEAEQPPAPTPAPPPSPAPQAAEDDNLSIPRYIPVDTFPSTLPSSPEPPQNPIGLTPGPDLPPYTALPNAITHGDGSRPEPSPSPPPAPPPSPARSNLNSNFTSCSNPSFNIRRSHGYKREPCPCYAQ